MKIFAETDGLKFSSTADAVVKITKIQTEQHDFRSCNVEKKVYIKFTRRGPHKKLNQFAENTRAHFPLLFGPAVSSIYFFIYFRHPL